MNNSIKPIDVVLAVAQNIKQIKPNEYMVTCPCHDDTKQSLHITEDQTNYKVLMRCHANCRNEDIMRAWGLQMRDLFPARTRDSRRIAAVYDYTDSASKLKYQSVRYEPKDFRQRRPDGSGGWIWNLQGIEYFPYRLPELKQALDAGKMVLVVEGEKDVDRLYKLGIPATCNHGGAGKWRQAHSEYFPPGSTITILPDNDEPGRKHAQDVAAQLTERECQVRILHLPDLPEKGDISDWLDAGHTKEELLQLIDEAPIIGQELWKEPIPFANYQAAPFPVNVLPPWLRDFVKALSNQSQVPLEFPALLSLAVIAIAGSKMFKIQARPGWIEPLNLYTMAILESGNRKSGTEKELLQPVHEFESELIKDCKPSWEQTKFDLECKKAALEDLKKQYVKARNNGGKLDKDGKPTGKTADVIKEDMDSLIKEIADSADVALPTILADDVTMEKLVVLLSENKGNLGIFAAEGTLFGIAAGRYSGAANFDDLLKAHAGDPIKSDRIGRGRVDVPDPALTIGMCVQPIVLQELAQNPVFRLKGLQARFLYAIPESPLGDRIINSPAIPKRIKDKYHDKVKRLLHNAQQINNKQTLELSPEANELLMEFEKWLEPKLKPTGELRIVIDWAAKLAGAILRIAGLLHIAEHCNEASIPLTVSSETMARAVELQEFLISHAQKTFDMMDVGNEEICHCTKVLNWFNEQPEKQEFSKRDLFCALQGTFKKVEYLDPVLALLVEHNFIREKEIVKTGPGRKSQVFEINPLNAKYAEYAKLNTEYNIADFADEDSDLKTAGEPLFWSDIAYEVDPVTLEVAHHS